MHHHCEIVIPPTDDIEAAIRSVLAPFDENNDGEDSSGKAFWDFWVIGGRWAGHKLVARFNKAKVDEFYAWLRDEGVTVSGLQCGKQELLPKSQEAKVDAKWNEMFPSDPPVPCPLFAHSNNEYGKGLEGTLPDDVCRLADVPPDLECSHVVFAGPSYNDGKWTGPVEAKFMLCDSAWNGCNHMKVDWDGKLSSALGKYRESMHSYWNDYKAAIQPGDDWLVVTVDYHS